VSVETPSDGATSPSPSAGAQPPSGGAASPSPSPSPPAETPSAGTPPPRDGPALPATVEVAIDSAPPGAQVVLDGAVLGITPYRGSVARRDRDARLTVRLPGYAERVIRVRASQPINERVTLAPRPAPAPANKGAKPDRDRSVNPF
jgi:hypothetical protein